MTSKLLYKSIFFILFLIANNSAFTQCKVEKKKGDFDTVATYQTSSVTIIDKTLSSLLTKKANWKLDVQFISTNNKIYLVAEHACNGMVSDLENFFIKFNDGSILKLDKPLEQREYTGLGSWRYQRTAFELDSTSINKLSITEVEKVQFQFSSFADSPSNEKKLNSLMQKRIKEYADCLIKELAKK